MNQSKNQDSLPIELKILNSQTKDSVSYFLKNIFITVGLAALIFGGTFWGINSYYNYKDYQKFSIFLEQGQKSSLSLINDQIILRQNVDYIVEEKVSNKSLANLIEYYARVWKSEISLRVYEHNDRIYRIIRSGFENSVRHGLNPKGFNYLLFLHTHPSEDWLPERGFKKKTNGRPPYRT